MDVGSDIRTTVRQLVRAPLYALTALAILGLGIGAGTAIFTVVNAVLLRPLPYEQADRLVSICETNASIDQYCVASPPNIMDWASAAKSFESMGFARQWSFILRQAEQVTEIAGGYAMPGWFRALRVKPEKGRLFEEADKPGVSRVAVLSHGTWVDRFGGDPDILGNTITLSGADYTVVGVLPATFVPADLGPVGVWTLPPWDPREEERRSWRGFAVAARLADGVSLDRARAELESVRAGLAPQYPGTNAEWGVRLLPLHEEVTGSTRPMFLVFGGAVALLLLVACLNLANLALVRATTRRREMAVRAAIGAGRLNLFRPLLTESLLLSVGGGLIGIALATLATRTIVRLAPAGIPRIEEAAVDLSTFLFAFGLAVATGVAVGLAPALWASRVDLATILRETSGAGRSVRGNRLRRTLVVGEIALTLTLLVGAGLLMRSLSGLLHWDPGFETHNLLAISAFAPPERYAGDDEVAALWSRLEQHIDAVPGVTSASTVSAGPIFGGYEPDNFEIVGDAVPDELPSVRWYDAAPSYFSTLGIRVVRGRALTEQDVRGTPLVALINQAFADRWFSNRDPIGQHIRMKLSGREIEVVGVVADVAPFEAGVPVEPQIWWSNRQLPRWGTFFVVRTSVDPASLTRAIRASIDAVDPEVQTRTPNTMDGLIGRRLVAPRFNLFLVGVLAAIALALASAGVYGVVSYTVATRRREICIRMALGEGRRNVLGRVLGEGAAMAGAGLVIGSVCALLLSRFLQSVLFGVTSKDPTTYVLTIVVLLGISIVASLSPAVRASRTDPAIVLREE